MGSIDLLIRHRWTGNVLQHDSGAVLECNGWTLQQRYSNVAAMLNLGNLEFICQRIQRLHIQILMT